MARFTKPSPSFRVHLQYRLVTFIAEKEAVHPRAILEEMAYPMVRADPSATFASAGERGLHS